MFSAILPGQASLPGQPDHTEDKSEAGQPFSLCLWLLEFESSHVSFDRESCSQKLGQVRRRHGEVRWITCSTRVGSHF